MNQRCVTFLIAIGVFVAGSYLAGCDSSGDITQSELIPRSVLFGNPERVSPRLSPDGLLWSFRAPVEGVMNVWVGTIGEDNARPVTADSLRGIQRYFWGYDSRRILYLEDDGGDENWRLCSVDIETLEATCLTPFEGVQVQIIDRNKNYPDELLIGLNKDRPQFHDVYHLHIPTAKLTKVATNPGNVAGWLVDAEFEVKAALAANNEGGYDLLVRGTASDAWRILTSWDSENALNSGPIGFTKDGQSLYVLDSRESNSGRLCRMNVTTGEIEEVLVEHPNYDVTAVEINPDSYEIEWVTIVKDRDSLVILGQSVVPDLEGIRRLHKGDFFVSSRDNSDANWMIGFYADDGPISYYRWNRPSQSATFLFDHRPELREYELSGMEPFNFVSRDSLDIHGYLTFPQGGERAGLPTVLLVHGGPWHRDTWGYNPEAQWLANRGYLCVQVNFRGSTGYGKDFLNAGDREWGGKMHDDLVDAVDYVIKQGFADPERVAIYGGSYGGYAALVGATFTPDLFCCAIDMVGVSNLLTFIESIPPYWESFREILHRRVGNPETDREFLVSRSPLFKADQIKIPMLIAQGANDPRVKQQEAEQIVAALKANRVDYEYLLFEDEGHGLAQPDNRIEFYSAAEKFLAKHLGGRCESDDTQPGK